jgi:hypothetical protein
MGEGAVRDECAHYACYGGPDKAERLPRNSWPESRRERAAGPCPVARQAIALRNRREGTSPREGAFAPPAPRTAVGGVEP